MTQAPGQVFKQEIQLPGMTGQHNAVFSAERRSHIQESDVGI